MNATIDKQAAAIRQFNRFYTNVIGLINHTILESPYSLAEVRVMLEMDNAGLCTASALTKLLQIDPGYLSRILKRFEREQLITKSKSLVDGRSQALSLTDKGRETFRKLSEASTLQIQSLLEQLSYGDRAQLVDHMAAIQTILSQGQDKAIRIRTKKPGDLGYIAYRHGVLYEKEYDLDPVFEQYVLASLLKYAESGQDGEIWVAEANNQIIGFIGIVGTDKATAQLRWFLIEPEFRGLGLGRQLMTIAMDYCRQKQYKRVFLWTFVGLDAARHLYRKFGFEPTEQVKNDTWKGGLIEERWDVSLSEQPPLQS